MARNDNLEFNALRKKVLAQTDISFYNFVKFVFSEACPGVPYKDNWHIKVICDHLQAVLNTSLGRHNPCLIPSHEVKDYMKADEIFYPYRDDYIFNPTIKTVAALEKTASCYDSAERENLLRLWDQYTRIRRLLIMIPPRYMKSMLTTVLFPDWAWTIAPGLKFLTGSHNLEVAMSFTQDSRSLIESPFFQRYWGHRFQLKDDANKLKNFKTNKGGHRQTFGISSGVTGLGGNFVLLDDPINITDADVVADSKEVQKALDTFRKSLITRLNGWDDVMVVIKQKACKDGLSTYIQENKEALGFDILEIPCEYIADSPCVTKFGSVDPRTKEGELLWPGRFPQQMIDALKFTMRSAFFMQYQQQLPSGDTKIIDTSWFKRYSYGKLPKMKVKIQSWDTAGKGSKGNDFWVCITFGVGVDDNIYILDVFRKRMNVPLGKDMIVAMNEKWNPEIIVVEDKSSGSSLIQEMVDDLPIVPFMPLKDKSQRMNNETLPLRDGRVFVPNNDEAQWVRGFITECDKFPFVRNDDQVDAFSSGLNFIKNNYTLGNNETIEIIELDNVDEGSVDYEELSYDEIIMMKIREKQKGTNDADKVA